MCICVCVCPKEICSANEQDFNIVCQLKRRVSLQNHCWIICRGPCCVLLWFSTVCWGPEKIRFVYEEVCRMCSVVCREELLYRPHGPSLRLVTNLCARIGFHNSVCGHSLKGNLFNPGSLPGATWLIANFLMKLRIISKSVYPNMEVSCTGWTFWTENIKNWPWS